MQGEGADPNDSQTGYWRQVEDLFHEALPLPADQRTAFLRGRCGGNSGMEREVAGIVESYQQQERLTAANSSYGRRYGSYEVISKLGAGGMGDVFLARRWEDFDQTVAIKVIGGGLLLQPWLEERFRQERQILASLEHPGIARLLNGGVTPAGEPYLVMEYVEGTRLDEYCRQHTLSIPERLRLFLRICEAVEAAHTRQVIHRDLKPGNILVNHRGEPKLLDFGIAKVLAPRGDDTGESAQVAATTGALLMTPAYTSPERLRGEPATVASDLYSLGVILYELLSGRRPDAAPPNASPAEIISAVITGQVQPPSEIAPAESKPLLRGGLDRILLKMLARKPEERYQSVRQLMDDLQRHLDGQPVLAQARTHTAAGVRKAWAISAGAAVAVGLAVFAVWTVTAAMRGRIDSLVVLPFEDLSADPQSGYLSDGLTDEITNDLAGVNGLRVIGRSTAIQFKGKTVDARQAGRQLHVEAVLAGSLVRDGDRVHIRARLSRTRDGSQIWSHSYDTHYRDLISVQQDIARSIADDLQWSRSKSVNAELLPPGSTSNPEAHDLYLQGLEAANIGTAQGLQKAIPLMQSAIARDSHYAAPWFSLAKMTEAMGYLGGWTPGLADQVRAHLDHALQLDPQMGAAHADLAYFDWAHGYDWDRAEREFQLALRLGNRAETHKLYAMSLADRGRFAESHEHLRIAEDLTPLDLELLFFEGGVLAWERRYPEAEQKYLSILQRNPKAAAALAALAYIKTWEQDCTAGAGFESRLTELAPSDYRTASVHFAMMVCRGDRAGALKLLNSADQARMRRLPALEMAQGYAYLGDKDAALHYLEQAVERHDFGATSMNQTPYFDPLHGDPRFVALARRVGLTP